MVEIRRHSTAVSRTTPSTHRTHHRASTSSRSITLCSSYAPTCSHSHSRAPTTIHLTHSRAPLASSASHPPTRSLAPISLSSHTPNRAHVEPFSFGSAHVDLDVFDTGSEPFSIANKVVETPQEGEGPLPVAPSPLRHRVDPISSGVWAWYRGRSFVAGVLAFLFLVGALWVSLNRLPIHVELVEFL